MGPAIPLIMTLLSFLARLWYTLCEWFRQLRFSATEPKILFYDIPNAKMLVHTSMQDDAYTHICERVYYDAKTGRTLRCLASTVTPVWKRMSLFATIKVSDDRVINITNAFNEYAPCLSRECTITCADFLTILALRGVIEWRDLFLIYKSDASTRSSTLFIMTSDLDEVFFSVNDVIAL